MSYKHILDAASLSESELAGLFTRAEFFLDSQNARPLSQLAAVSFSSEASIAKTQVYKEVHADLRSAATSEFANAVEFGERSTYEPPCKGKTLFNIFLENSTRTRASFEVAGQRLGMNVVNITGDSSSVKKGESLVDTVRTICAMGADVITIRIRNAGVIAAAAATATCPVINAGEGAYQHPTQAFLDAFTIARSLKRNDLEGLKVAICGDVLHSRVARSNIQLLGLLGAEIILAGPPSLIPRCISGVSIAANLDDAITYADVIIMLRIQSERMQAGFIPSLADYHEVYGLKEKHLEIIKPGALIMHPGPVNWGVEMSRFYEARPDITMITQQVQIGVAVRTALLEMLL